MMRQKRIMRMISAALVIVMTSLLLSGCGGGKTAKSEEQEPISVYLWSVNMLNDYAPYIQAQLPDVEIEFVVGNNDLDFYKFLNENGTLPDIITCRRFSLHDAADLQGQLMDLSTTEEAASVYDSYLVNFSNSDGSVNWLPLCGEVDGLVANKALFDAYEIPLPTDYASFVSACQAFEALGIRGFTADFDYDYTCMELLQGLSIPELSSMEGQMWRRDYENPAEEAVGLDQTIWPEAFSRLEQFIQDTDLTAADLAYSYDPVVEMFEAGQVAIIRACGFNVVAFQKAGQDAVLLPYFGQHGEQWLLTYPAFQVALNQDLEKDKEKQQQAMQVLRVMLSEDAQNVLAQGEDVITYNRNVDLTLDHALENVKPYIEQNHLYIRIASNEFFSISRDVVHKMILGEYDAQQAYKAFDEQLKQPTGVSDEPILTLHQGYENRFYKDGGNAASSVMANTLRQYYGSDVLVAPSYSFTGSVMQAAYTEKMVGNMIMPNALEAWQCTMTGAELKAYLKASVEGKDGCFTPFNRASLPTVSGISIEVREKDGSYILEQVYRDGAELNDTDVFQVICLNPTSYMKPLVDLENGAFQKKENRVKPAWVEYIKNGGTLAEPENYMTLQ